MIGITNSAEPLAISLPVALLITGYARHDKAMVRNGWQTVAALGITGIISTGLKYSVNRTRPYITYPDIQNYNTENTASFPSGHTSFAFATATSLSINYRMWYVVAPAYLWAASVGYSRLYLGEHYPTDVLAGCIVGAGSAWLAYKGDQWLHRRKEQRHKVPQ
jgi:membrane-associated phospholipid phosphatase